MNRCHCPEGILQKLDEKIAFHGGNFLNANIYGIKKNFSQKTYDRLLNYKRILTTCNCLSKDMYSRILEKIKTEI